MDLFDQIFENNKAWAEAKKTNNQDYFKKLSEGQTPEILYIGCSDSRVTPEQMTGVEQGDLFVHRNVANLVPNTDHNSSSVIEYAVGHLKVKHVVVCGHYFCGGVKAAMQSADLGALNPWLRNIRDVYRLHQTELDAILDENDRYNRLVELNVKEQCINVIKMSVVQKTYMAGGTPEVHGLVFDIHSGELIDLKIDFEKELKGIKEIYDLGTTK